MPIDYPGEFDIPRDTCYLNACYMTPQPRAEFANQVGCSPDNVASVRGDYLRVAPHLYADANDLARIDEVPGGALPA